MLARNEKHTETLLADLREAELARAAVEKFRNMPVTGESVTLNFPDTTSVVLPKRAVGLIQQVLEAMASRKPVSFTADDTELTTQQAADYLNLSRPFLVKQLNAGRIRYRKVGSHRRLRLSDVIAYAASCQVQQEQALAQLNDEARRLGLE